MNAEHLQPLAAVRPAAAAGVTCWIVDIRLDRTAVARSDVGHLIAHRDDFNAQLVSQYPRIGHERHLADIGADVSSANANPMDTHQRLAAARRQWFGQVNLTENFRSVQPESMHRISRKGAEAQRKETDFLFS